MVVGNKWIFVSSKWEGEQGTSMEYKRSVGAAVPSPLGEGNLCVHGMRISSNSTVKNNSFHWAILIIYLLIWI